MPRKESEKQIKGKEIAAMLGIAWDSPGKVFKEIEKKGFKWKTQLKEWIKPSKTLKISIEWNDDGHIEDLAETIIKFLEGHDDYTFELANPKYQSYKPSEYDKNGKRIGGKGWGRSNIALF